MTLRKPATVICAVLAAVLLASCGSADTSSPQFNPPPAAEPAVSPPVVATPVGIVIKVGNSPEGIVVGTAGTAAVAVRDPDGVVLVDLSAAAATVRTMVPTDGAARHLSLVRPEGPVIAPLESSNSLIELRLNDGAIVSTTKGVGQHPHDAVATQDGTIAVSNEGGGGVVFVKDGAVVGALPAGPIQPGGAAIVGAYAVLADVRGLGVWVYDATRRQMIAKAPLGVGLTHVRNLAREGEANGFGDASTIVAFADTVGGAVYLEKVALNVLDVARIDAPGRPYGLGYDAQNKLLFITLTATNLLRVVDVADPTKPKVLGDLPTVRQPNSVAVDPTTHTVLVTGTADGQLQLIPSAALPKEPK